MVGATRLRPPNIIYFVAETFFLKTGPLSFSKALLNPK
jgi:hypothetical protein